MAKRQILLNASITAFAMIVLVVPGWLGAGTLTPPAGDPAPTMKTLEDVP